MGSSGVDSDKHDDDGPPREASIDALLDRAVRAINSGDRAAASALAGQVLAVDEGNTEGPRTCWLPPWRSR